MPELKDTAFKKEIEKGALTGAYLLYGDEKYTMLQSVQKVIQKVTNTGFADFNLHRFDAADTSADQIAEAVESLPFFAEQKVVILRDLNVDSLAADELEAYQNMIRDLPESTVLIIYLPAIMLEKKRLSTKWKNFFSTDAKKLTLVEFARKTNSDLEKYLVTYAEKRGCELSRDLAKRILQLCGTDLQTLSHEISKVCGFAGGGVITREQIDTAVTVNSESQVFDLSKAIIGGNYERAYKIIDDLMAQNEEPIAIVAMLSSAYLNLYRVKTMLRSGRDPMELSTAFDYKNKAFLISNAEQDSSRFSTAMLRESLDLLLEADLNLKGGAGSSRNEMKRVVLDELVAKLLLAAQEKDR